jgi:hypothetical protein
MSKKSPPQRTAAQIRRDELDKQRVENEHYMRAHPELNDAFQEFIYTALKRRPEDIHAFAVDFFTKPIAEPA